ncbi:DUF5684 domain-containing protein [uncultured Microbacterium sp.]|uniref:DUF5684 domain-containing protein n=1 Tax=uncultured Microbacterium sp. TaxID=191216 RepID=UPI00261B934D|nr:DUF5684 domain-containing protein [uncultured Microbacterium sp.]
MTPMVDESLLSLLGLFGLVIGVIGYLWAGLALSAMFRKMGEEPWKGWVPFLNLATVLRWGGFNPWLVLVGLFPVVGPIVLLILLIVSAHRINPGFGYGTGMTVLAAFFFIIWASILGFGPARWLGARAAAWRPAVTDPLEAASAASPVEPAASAASPVVAPPSTQVETSPDAFAPPPPRTGPVWVPPDITTSPPAAAAPLAPAVEARPIASVAPVTPVAAAPVTPPAPPVAEEPEEISWPSEIDDVSAVFPSPFPPSAAAGRRYAAPPVREDEPADDHSGPIAFVPGRRSSAEPAAVEPPVTRMPAAVPGTRRAARTDDSDEPEAFPELSGEVSAVIGAPSAGTPRSAMSSVSAQQRRQEPFGDEDDDLERTVIARRLKRPAWELVPASGVPLPLTADVVILGRRPAADPAFPRAQLLAVPDSARTVSKTHARIELRGERWQITDLASTNGVLLRTLMGEELEIEPGTELQAGERFYLGDEEFLLHRVES